METSIIQQDDGYLASANEKSIFFPNAELLNVGCKNCIWKLHSQCPYGLKDDEVIEFTEFEESEKESTKTYKIYPDFNSYASKTYESVDSRTPDSSGDLEI